MDGDLVLGEFVDTLEDIDLTAIRPIRAVLPPRRPRSTTSGHVPRIKQDQTALESTIISSISRRSEGYSLHFLSVETDGFSTPSTGVFACVDLHHSMTFTVGRYKTLVPRLTGILVIDCSMGRIIVIPKVEIVEESVALLPS